MIDLPDSLEEIKKIQDEIQAKAKEMKATEKALERAALKELKDAQKSQERKQAADTEERVVIDFFHKFFKEKQIQIDGSGALSSTLFPTSTLYTELKKRLKYADPKSDGKWGTELLSTHIHQYVHKRYQEALEPLQSKTPSIEPSLAICELWRAPKTVISRSAIEVDAFVLRQWIWNVKTRMRFLKTPNPIAIFLYGGQGCGKSYSLSLLTKPLEFLTATVSLAALNSSSETGIWLKYPILIAEEIAGASRTDISQLKALITQTAKVYRKYYTQDSISQHNHMNLLGTTNDQLHNILYDTTGMRRWHQIVCPTRQQEKMNISAIEKFDYLQLWQSVDETQPEPFLEHKDLYEQFLAFNRTTHARSGIQDFLAMRKIPADFDPESGECENVLITKFFDDYKSFIQDGSYSDKISISRFKSRLQENGIPCEGRFCTLPAVAKDVL